MTKNVRKIRYMKGPLRLHRAPRRASPFRPRLVHASCEHARRKANRAIYRARWVLGSRRGSGRGLGGAGLGHRLGTHLVEQKPSKKWVSNCVCRRCTVWMCSSLATRIAFNCRAQRGKRC